MKASNTIHIGTLAGKLKTGHHEKFIEYGEEVYRPLRAARHGGLLKHLKAVWLVLIGKADALVWHDDKDIIPSTPESLVEDMRKNYGIPPYANVFGALRGSFRPRRPVRGPEAPCSQCRAAAAGPGGEVA